MLTDSPRLGHCSKHMDVEHSEIGRETSISQNPTGGLGSHPRAVAKDFAAPSLDWLACKHLRQWARGSANSKPVVRLANEIGFSIWVPIASRRPVFLVGVKYRPIQQVTRQAPEPVSLEILAGCQNPSAP
jgi:hypothetical protein